MKSGWNYIGIVAWVVVLFVLVLIIQNIRKRHIKMIVMDHTRFSMKNLVLDTGLIIVWLAAFLSMGYFTFFDNPSLNDSARISDSVTYRPLILTVDKDKSYYVNVTSDQNSVPNVEYTVLGDGKKITLNGRNSSVSYDANPLSLAAKAYPFDQKALVKTDVTYQKAYLATYTARYKDNWRNGLGLNAKKVAARYYLIRVPDQTFIKDKDKDSK